MHLSYFRRCALVLVVAIMFAGVAHAELSKSQARNVIRKMAGADLPGSAVRVKSISTAPDGTSEVTADIKAVFKFEQIEPNRWRVAEIRTGQDSWLRLSHVTRALNTFAPTDVCLAPDPPLRNSVDPSAKRARCVIAHLLGVSLPSDEVRIRQVSPMGVPFVSQPSAIVEALVEVHARLANQPKQGWRVTALRTGNRNWMAVDSLLSAIEVEMRNHARAELEQIAAALKKYQLERGMYVVSESQSVLMDHLNPKYLLPVLRLDPWNQPYQYQGERDRFTLSSSGPDRKSKTADDITLSS